MAKHLATITLIGHDKAGVIARITQLLFQLGANIEAMEEQVTRGQFSMTLQASWTPARFDRAEIEHGVREAARDLKMETKVHFAPVGPQRLAIFVTKEPHVLEGLLAKSPAALGARPVVVIGNRPGLAPLARRSSLPFCHVPFNNRAKAEQQVLKLLEKHEVDFIVLARFMKILSPNFVWRWKNKIINIHPSLLPAFPGANAYRQAYERGVKVVGVTAHFVTPNLDEGPIIAQEALFVRSNEPLGGIVKRGQALETKCVLRAVRAYVTKRLDVHWGRVYS
ncbi:MAG TPA: formyltetrahydrofolate deformylase [Candidatus Methylacidiphilales bacterium]|jgi:formyltetrahydrofolate deformylase|nr:formyltetrahydrofolate deformylase [Candidatus Methylacidiphilales bacterium]